MSIETLRVDGSYPVLAPAMARSVLLVEDNPNNRRVLQIMLQHLGIEPVVAVDGKDAVERFAEATFDLILMDLHMPQMDGLEAARRIREIELAQGRPHTPIMAVTANTMAADRDACAQAGMDDFIAKPVTREPFLNRVDHWLQMEAAETMGDEDPQQTPAPAPASSVYDLTVLTRLGSDVGEDLIPELLTGFEEDLRQHLETIPQLRESGDVVTLTRTAHSLKSSAATFGANDLSAVALRVETHGRQGEDDAMYAALPELLAQMEKALHHMPK